MYLLNVTASASLLTSRRFDRGGELLRASFRRASDGALLCEGIPVREGVLVYRTADGRERRELVTREAVLDTARTIARAPLTLDHPSEGFVTADSVKELGVGDVDGRPIVEEDAQGGFVKVGLAVRRRDALDAIAAGVHELSPGYEVTLDETPGTHPVFGRYDARQIGREVNHLALVPKGRGDRVVLRADSADAIQVGVAPLPAGPARIDRSPEDRPMKSSLVALLTLLGVSRFDSEDAAIGAGLDAAKALKADADKRKDAEEEAKTSESEAEKMKAENETLKADLAKKTGECDAMKAELDKLKGAEADRKDAAELTRLQGVAARAGVKHDGLKLPELRVAIAKTRIDSIDASTPAAYVDGILAIVEADAGKRGDRYDFREPPPKARADRENDRADEDPTRRDSHYSPHLAHADKARAGSVTSTQGASR